MDFRNKKTTEEVPMKKRKYSRSLSVESARSKSSSASNENSAKKDGPPHKKLKEFVEDKTSRKVLRAKGVKYLFPIQEKTYKTITKGEHIVARDRTGSGKTLAYTLPLTERLRSKGKFEKLMRGQQPYVLVVLPTRELAIQVSNEFRSLMHKEHKENEFRVLTIYGGTDIRAQTFEINSGCEVIAGTPGRIIDMIKRDVIKFDSIRTIVLDEVDVMLDIGFKDDIEQILSFIHKDLNGDKLQHCFFSATIPYWVQDLSRKYMGRDYEYVDLVKGSEVKTSITVEHLAILCPYSMRIGAMGDVVSCYGGRNSRCIIFTETKQEANDILLKSNIKQDCQVLHGDIPQKQREITFQGFREGKFKCLIATNVAARGLDIPEVDLIVQLDPPKDVDSYIHRSGRTARAGRQGVCVTFYTKKQISLIERIEMKANLKFKKVGAPQPIDILKSSIKDISIGLKDVSNEVLPHFHENAEFLIGEMGAKEALSRALAYISGYTSGVKQRSLLSSIEGYVTFLVRSKSELRSVGPVWGFLKKYLSPAITDSIKGMKSFKDRMGAAFDVPDSAREVLDDIAQKSAEENSIEFDAFKVELATELPDLQEDDYGMSGGFGGFPNFRDNRSGGYGGGGYNGYSGGGGYRGGGGGGGGFYNNRNSSGDRNNHGSSAQELFIGNLPFDVSEPEIKDFFEKYNCSTHKLFIPKGIFFILMIDQATGKPKGFAFLKNADSDSVTKFLNLNNIKFKDRNLRIRPSEPREKTPDSNSGGRFGGMRR